MKDDFESEGERHLIGVGFWRDPLSPATKNWPDPNDMVDYQWDVHEREKVVKYLRSGGKYRSWFGEATCLFNCGIDEEEGLGTRDLTDGVYFWPEGYVHYLEKHQVKPPEEFLAHVREQLRRRSSDNDIAE